MSEISNSKVDFKVIEGILQTFNYKNEKTDYLSVFSFFSFLFKPKY